MRESDCKLKHCTCVVIIYVFQPVFSALIRKIKEIKITKVKRKERRNKLTNQQARFSTVWQKIQNIIILWTIEGETKGEHTYIERSSDSTILPKKISFIKGCLQNHHKVQ